MTIRIGISACLIGQKVRFDGGHKEDRFLTRTLGKYFEWVPVCPEAELGLGTPREAMRLAQIDGATRLVMPKSDNDLTEVMGAFAKTRMEALAAADLTAYILKSDSPSCGMERVRIYSASGMPARSGRGLFAATLMASFPNMPVEEEGRLCDPRIRENWIERVFAYRRLQQLWRSGWTIRSMIEFHTAHKLLLLTHVPQAYENLGSSWRAQKRSRGSGCARPMKQNSCGL